MPIEIREVVIKAQLEKPFSNAQNQPVINSTLLSEMKEEILLELLEEVEDKLARRLER